MAKTKKKEVGRPELPDEQKKIQRGGPNLTDQEYELLVEEFGSTATIRKACLYAIQQINNRKLKSLGIIEAKQDEAEEIAIEEAAKALKDFISSLERVKDTNGADIIQRAIKK